MLLLKKEMIFFISFITIDWRPEWGSNPRPLAWQASVLTNWTTGPYGNCKKVAGAVGLEPTTYGFGDRCSTNWTIPLYKLLNYYITTYGYCQELFLIFLHNFYKNFQFKKANVQCMNRHLYYTLVVKKISHRTAKNTGGIFIIYCWEFTCQLLSDFPVINWFHMVAATVHNKHYTGKVNYHCADNNCSFRCKLAAHTCDKLPYNAANCWKHIEYTVETSA